MTLFRKYYRDANDSIKPDEAFVESVIKNAKKHRPPLYARYTKYAAAAAAAVVIVSGAVLSMPLWQRVTDNEDGVIIEETVTDNAAVGSKAAETAAPVAAAEPETKPTAVPQTKATSAPKQAAKTKVSESRSQSKSPAYEEAGQEEVADTEPQLSAETAEDNISQTEPPALRKAVAAESDEEIRDNAMPEDMAPYSEPMTAMSAPDAVAAALEDEDIPAPEGYYCVGVSPNGYTFANDEGAVIIVTVNYGGEEREPYISEDGDNIYAVFTSFGLSVTINASGADRSAVEEIINSLR